MIGSLRAAGKTVSASRQGQGRKFSKVVALSLAAGVVLGGQVPAQAAPRIGQLPDVKALLTTRTRKPWTKLAVVWWMSWVA